MNEWVPVKGCILGIWTDELCVVITTSVETLMGYVAPLLGPIRLTGSNRIRDALIPLSVTPQFFFKSVATRISCPTRMVDPNQIPVYSDRFHLSYQKHFYLCHFFLEFSITQKLFQMVGP